MIFPGDGGWFYQDEEDYIHGPFLTRDEADAKCREYWSKYHAEPITTDDEDLE